MRILIDATNIINQPTGAGRYSYNILKNLSEIDNHNNYTIIVRKDLKDDHLIFSYKNFNFIKLNIATIGIKRDIFLSLFLFLPLACVFLVSIGTKATISILMKDF